MREEVWGATEDHTSRWAGHQESELVPWDASHLLHDVRTPVADPFCLSSSIPTGLKCSRTNYSQKQQPQIIPHHVAWMWQMEEVRPCAPLPVTMPLFSACAAHLTCPGAYRLIVREPKSMSMFFTGQIIWPREKDKNLTVTNYTVHYIMQRDWNKKREVEEKKRLGCGDRLDAHSLTEPWN